MELYQVFCTDPNGIKVELNFEGQDRPLNILKQEYEARLYEKDYLLT